MCSRASSSETPSKFWARVYEEQQQQKEKACPITCPFCSTDMKITGFAECKCVQRDRQCSKCHQSWHVCKVGNVVRQTGHPCPFCM